MQIPFVNLTRQNNELEESLVNIFREIISTKSYIGGPYLDEFESSFSNIVGKRHVVGCSNGTTALFLALDSLGICEGDEVITTSHTFAATAEAILHVRAVPVLIDICANDYNIDVNKIEASITPKTKAIIPVHIYGTVCNMPEIQKIAKKHNLVVIEDAAQAHMAELKEGYAGTFGDAAAFSFYPGKNLGAMGDAGAVVFKKEEHATLARKLANHGRSDKYLHDIPGYNFRMDDIQAAILNLKLKKLKEWTENRRKIAAIYDNHLKPKGFKVINPDKGNKPCYHLYVVEVSNRNEVVSYLKNKGIVTGIHYPVPIHKQPAFSNVSSYKELPVTDNIVERIVSLPVCGNINQEEAKYVADCFLEIAKI